jgi:TfoX N-terminal domain
MPPTSGSKHKLAARLHERDATMTLVPSLDALMRRHDPRVQKMFGGTAYLVNNNLVIGTHGEGLIVRVGPEAVEAALDNPHARQMEMGGRVMKGWILVDADGATAQDLPGWVALAMAFNATLPPDAAKARKAPKAKATP